MKKLLALVLAVLVLIPSAWAEVDLSSLVPAAFAQATNEDLQRLIDLARNELYARQLIASPEYVTVIDTDDVKIYLDGEYGYNAKHTGLFLHCVFMNDSNSPLAIYCEECYVNGWKAYCGMLSEIAPGKKSHDSFGILISDAGISDYSEVEEIEWHLYACARDDSYSNRVEFTPITICFNQE